MREWFVGMNICREYCKTKKTVVAVSSVIISRKLEKKEQYTRMDRVLQSWRKEFELNLLSA